MAGYILKISMENTHPPVWRRVVVPKGITFLTLHEIIQVVFGWEDVHLHEFRTSDGESLITEEEDGIALHQYEESETRVNEFLEGCKWIRYTYDFGDDWRHRVVLEKEDPSYTDDYAVALKYKGDNFIEDYYWYDEEEEDDEEADGRSRFELEVVNSMLCDMDYHFSDQAPSERVSPDADSFGRAPKPGYDGAEPEDPESVLQEMESLPGSGAPADEDEPVRKRHRARHLSHKMKMMDNVRRFCTDWVREIEYHFPTGNRYQWEITDSEVSMQSALRMLNKTELLDYCKYWGISAKSTMSKETLAAKAAQLFSEEPLNLCYLFSIEEFSELFKIMEKKTMPRDCREAQANAVLKAIALGLIEARVTDSGDSKKADLWWTEGADEILGRLQAMPWEWKIKETESVKKAVLSVLKLYGIVEFDFLYDRICEWDGIRVSFEEAQKIFYCGISFPRLAVTASLSLDGKKYIMDNMLNVEMCLVGLYQFAAESDWYPFTESDREQSEQGFQVLYSCWNEMKKLFRLYAEVSDFSMDELLEEVYFKVRDGEPVTVVMKQIHNMVPIDEHSFRQALWADVMSCCMDTGLPMLRGFSRRELAKAQNMPVFLYDLFDEDVLLEDVRKNTPIYRMPSDIQMELFEAYEMPDTEEAVAEMQEVAELICEDNFEIRFMIGSRYFEQGEYQKAGEILWPLRRELRERDPYLNRMLKRIKMETKQTVLTGNESRPRG